MGILMMIEERDSVTKCSFHVETDQSQVSYIINSLLLSIS